MPLCPGVGLEPRAPSTQRVEPPSTETTVWSPGRNRRERNDRHQFDNQSLSWVLVFGSGGRLELPTNGLTDRVSGPDTAKESNDSTGNETSSASRRLASSDMASWYLADRRRTICCIARSDPVWASSCAVPTQDLSQPWATLSTCRAGDFRMRRRSASTSSSPASDSESDTVPSVRRPGFGVPTGSTPERRRHLYESVSSMWWIRS